MALSLSDVLTPAHEDCRTTHWQGVSGARATAGSDDDQSWRAAGYLPV